MQFMKEAKMRKALTAAMAAITLGGALCATATSADARPFAGGYSHGYYGGHYRGGSAVIAGVAGLAIGAALASNHGPYYGGYYGPGYYNGPYTCVTTRWVWDPYYGRTVPVRQPYAC
jgi:hypothetical protein